jgi:hypothetical protein
VVPGWRASQNCVFDIKTHVTHPVEFVLHNYRWESKINQPLPSVDDIAAIAKNATMENAIFIAQTEISCLDDLSLDGDIPDDVSNTS